MEGCALGEVHPTAVVSNRALVGEDVTIGAYTLVYDNVEIGEGSVVGPHVILGEPTAAYYGDVAYENPVLVVGAGSLIRSGSIVYAGSALGEAFQCGHTVTIRENATVGRHCSVGTFSDIQGDCVIGDYTRLHSSVHVAQKSRIGSYVWLFPSVVLTNDPHPPSETRLAVHIDDYAVVAAGAVLLPGVRVGKGALIGANALVRQDVAPATVVAGQPGRLMGDVQLIRSPESGDAVYPWPLHFGRGMPWEEVGYEAWIEARESGSGDGP